MTPQEKAEALVEQFRPHSKYWDCFNDEPLEENHAKQSALVAVDEILNLDYFSIEGRKYWQQVKQEIEKL